MSRICRCGCGKSAALVCFGCKSAVYFDAECQKRDWPIHRQICFMEGILDLPKTISVGARFKGVIVAAAWRVPRRYVEAFDERTKQFLFDIRNVPMGIFCITQAEYDRRRWSTSEIYDGVVPYRGALYVRGLTGTEEFRNSMAKLSALGTDRGAQGIITKKAAGFFEDARDFDMEEVEHEMWAYPESIPEEYKGNPNEYKIALIGAIANYSASISRDSLALPCDILRAASLTMMIEKWLREGTVAKGMRPEEIVRHPAIDSILDGVWSRVDVGLLIDKEDTPVSMARAMSIPDDLLRRCTRCSVWGNSGPCVLLLRKMPNLRLLRVLRLEITPFLVAEVAGLRALQEIEYDLEHESDYLVSADAPFANPEIRVKRLAIPMASGPMRFPETLERLHVIQQHKSVKLSNLGGGTIINSLVSLRIDATDFAVEPADDVANVIATFFPNISEFELNKDEESEDLLRSLLPRLRHLSSLKVTVNSRGIMEIVKFFESKPNPMLRELSITEAGDPWYSEEEAPRVRNMFANVPALKRLGLNQQRFRENQTVLRAIESAPHPLDLLDVWFNEGIYPTASFDPRVLRVMGGRLENLTRLTGVPLDIGHPKALVWWPISTEMHMPPSSSLTFMRDLVALSLQSKYDVSNASRTLEEVLNAAPRLNFLSISFGIIYPDYEYRGPTGSLHTLIVSVYEDDVDDLFDKILSRIESPENLVIKVHNSLRRKIDENTIRLMLSRVPNTHTLLLKGVSRNFPRTMFYPADVIVKTTNPILWKEKYDELAWFEDPWNRHYDSI